MIMAKILTGLKSMHVNQEKLLSSSMYLNNEQL